MPLQLTKPRARALIALRMNDDRFPSIRHGQSRLESPCKDTCSDRQLVRLIGVDAADLDIHVLTVYAIKTFSIESVLAVHVRYVK